MKKSEAVLAILASAKGQTLSPVQLQKAAFLLDRNNLLTGDRGFNFAPYDYGPFDKAVYDEASALAARGLAFITSSPWGRWNVYGATDRGISEGLAVLERLPVKHRRFVEDVTEWVRGQSFSSLVKSIYQQYPEMKANSVFQG